MYYYVYNKYELFYLHILITHATNKWQIKPKTYVNVIKYFSDNCHIYMDSLFSSKQLYCRMF